MQTSVFKTVAEFLAMLGLTASAVPWPDADHKDRQTRVAGAAGPRRAVLDGAVRALSTLGAGAGGSAGGDVRTRRFASQGQGDYRGAVRL